MIQIFNFKQKITLLQDNNINIDNVTKRNRFVPCIKVRASVSYASPDRLIINTRKLKYSDNVKAIEWNNKIFSIISMKSDKQFCVYTAQNAAP